MKKLKTILAIVLCFALGWMNAFAQKPPLKYGKISDQEINMTVYDKDTSASAVVIADYEKAEIVYTTNIGFQLQVSRHKRIKILKTDGIYWAKGTIRLYRSNSGEDEDLGSFKACTYNMENGKLVETKLTRKEVIREEESKNFTLRKFALTNVKVGSIIEYEYSYTSPFFLSLQDWYFQDEIPVIWSELRTIIPEFYEFRRATGGYLHSTISEESQNSTTIPNTDFRYSNNIQRVVFQDVPAFKNEQFITTPRDYLARVEFELRSIQYPQSTIEYFSTTWEKIGENLMKDENFGMALNRHGIVKELTEQINQSDTPMVKINNAVALIKKQMKWNESLGFLTTKSLRDAFNKNQGNMAEINLLLVNLLRSVGIDANPVLFSSRDHGTIRIFYPMMYAFNGVLASAKVNGKDILLDATSTFYNTGEINPAYINGKGMKVLDTRIEWIPLLNTEQYSTVSMTNLRIENNQVKAEIVQSNGSSSGARLRNKIAKKGKQQYIDDFKKDVSDWDIKDYVIENEQDVSKPVTEKLFVENFNQIDATSDMIYIPSIVTAEKEINPFASDTRLYPVDFAVPINERNILNIAIPEGYNVEELPAEIKLTLPDNAASFVYMARKNGQIIQVSSTFRITRTNYSPDEYKLLKEFYKNVISKHGEQIVLKKI
jgi:hypothetical protein